MKAVNLPAAQTLTAVDEIEFAVTDLTEEDLTSARSVSDYFVSTGTLKAAPDLESALLLGWWTEHRADS